MLSKIMRFVMISMLGGCSVSLSGGSSSRGIRTTSPNKGETKAECSGEGDVLQCNASGSCYTGSVDIRKIAEKICLGRSYEIVSIEPNPLVCEEGSYEAKLEVKCE